MTKKRKIRGLKNDKKPEQRKEAIKSNKEKDKKLR